MKGLESFIISMAIKNEGLDENSRILAIKGAFYQIMTLIRSMKIAKNSHNVSVRITAGDSLDKIEGFINGAYSDEQAIEAFIDQLRSLIESDDE